MNNEQTTPTTSRSFGETKALIEGIQCSLLGQDFIIRFDSHPGNEERWFLQVGMERECAYTGKPGTGFGGKYEVSQWSTKDEIVKKVLGACLAYAEHETREGFFFEGDRLFNPHITVEALASICAETASRPAKS